MMVATLGVRWAAAVIDWGISFVVNRTGPMPGQFGPSSIGDVPLGIAWDVCCGITYYIITVVKDAAPGVTERGLPAAACNGSTGPLASAYFASANPEKPSDGKRYFATDTRGIIFYSLAGPVGNPIPPDTPVLQ